MLLDGSNSQSEEPASNLQRVPWTYDTCDIPFVFLNSSKKNSFVQVWSNLNRTQIENLIVDTGKGARFKTDNYIGHLDAFPLKFHELARKFVSWQIFWSFTFLANLIDFLEKMRTEFKMNAKHYYVVNDKHQNGGAVYDKHYFSHFLWSRSPPTRFIKPP